MRHKAPWLRRDPSAATSLTRTIRELLDLNDIDDAPASGLGNLVRTRLAHATTEQVAVTFMDERRRPIALETMWQGTADRCAFHAADVIARAVELGAAGVVVAHNHPSGDPTPSGRDVEATRELVLASVGSGILVHDHLVVARRGVVSFRQRGLM